MADREETRFAAVWHGWVRPLVVVLLVVTSFRSALADWHDVPTQSMEPTILAGDRIAVNKLAYDVRVPFTTWRLATWDDPQRGEIVTFIAPHDGRRYVKRVIGVAGDRVAMHANRLTINGSIVPLERIDSRASSFDDLSDPGPHLFAREALGAERHAIMMLPARRAQRTFDEVSVPPGHVLVMGDNRDNSGDSRRFGFIPVEAISGRVFGVAFSLDHDQAYLPRWDRFCRSVD
jgi:signal peptidase I